MANIDNTAIYVAYYIGEDLESGDAVYTEPQEIYANVGTRWSVEEIKDIGRIPDYDRTIYLYAGDKTRFINTTTRLWVDSFPNEARDNFDYTIVRKSDELGGILRLYCLEVVPDTQSLYYCNDGEHIFKIKIFYDAYTAVIPKDMYCEINEKSKVWYKKPSGVDDTKHLIKLIKKTEYDRTFTYLFEAVD